MKSRKKAKSLEEEQKRVIEQVAARLKALRLEKGHTSYEKFAISNDIDRSQYGKYERGVDMQISSLVKVLTTLNVSIGEFFSKGFNE